VVYNGVDLARYTPGGDGDVPQDRIRLLLVEGAIAGGYEWGLETAIKLAEGLQIAHSHKIELMVVGRASATLQAASRKTTSISLAFTGQVPPTQIPTLDRSAHLLYASDLNPACPNSAIEALACGLPVVAFDTGALPELIQSGAGRCVRYGGDPWKLEPPDITRLVDAAHDIIQNQSLYRPAARARAVEAFGLDQMLEGYLGALDL
jgi:glycosyltransferase involved in cell wall biosynthesis